jgi:hypothetical protein
MFKFIFRAVGFILALFFAVYFKELYFSNVLLMIKHYTGLSLFNAQNPQPIQYDGISISDTDTSTD